MDLEDLDVDTLQCYAWFADSTIMVGVLETIWELHTLILMYTHNSCHCYCDHCTCMDTIRLVVPLDGLSCKTRMFCSLNMM